MEKLDVYSCAVNRMKTIFEEFDNVLVAFSCGKDSGVMLSIAYQYAKENDLMHKLSFYYEDYEANYQHTHDYAERVFNELNVCKKYWLCLPISAACSCSMYETRWIPWDVDKKDIWVRPMPKHNHVVNEDNCPYVFIKGTKGFDARIQFAEWFAAEHGKTAVLVGIRADESLTRRAIFTSKHRKHMYKDLRFSTKVQKDLYNFYPIFDWKTSDVWVANCRFGFDYNKLYDLYHQAGLTIDQMRVASPFHQCGQGNLKLYRVIDPNSWAKMVGRVNGVNFTGIYGGTTAMGWKNLQKPKHFTWKQYAEFLLDTLPSETKKKFIDRLEQIKKTWVGKGYGRNPQRIQQMIDEGLEIEKTGVISNLCKKDGIYEIVKMKSEIPDETQAPIFRLCPSWKAVCITIMKNDWGLQTMGCSRTKDANLLRTNALLKYKEKTA